MARQADRQHAAPCLKRDRSGGLDGTCYACIVDENVEPAQPLDGAGKETIGRSKITRGYANDGMMSFQLHDLRLIQAAARFHPGLPHPTGSRQ
ncbi:hypothetical protein NLM16_05965 [Bradyrhizobium brasilense]|nr:hypothetical protein [Bradyrhizobium brasilense]MCP3413640.1 hypothetical protein [Bradyrhizobium brasilense]